MSQFVITEEMPGLRDILNELLELDVGLSDFEVDFIESLSHWEGCFTRKQAVTIEKIYKRVG